VPVRRQALTIHISDLSTSAINPTCKHVWPGRSNEIPSFLWPWIRQSPARYPY